MSSAYTYGYNLESFHKVLDYFEGKMEEEEHVQLEAFIESNVEFEEWVDMIHDAWLRNPDVRNMALGLHHDLMTKFESKARALDKSGKRRQLIIRFSLALSAVIAAIFIINSLRKPCLSTFKAPEIAQRAGGVYEQQFLTMGANRPQGDSIVEAFELYDKGDYANAGAHFKELLKKNPKERAKMEMTMSLGVSLFMEEKYEAALPYFEIAIGFREPKYALEAKWYQSLCYKELGKLEKSLKIWEQLDEEGNFYKEYARSLQNCR